MPFIYINSKRRYALILFFPPEKKKMGEETSFNSIIHVSRIILYKPMSYLHEKIYVFIFRRYHQQSQNSSILILLYLFDLRRVSAPRIHLHEDIAT